MSHDAHDTWESYRPFLEMLARSRVPGDRRGVIDPSGAVQETLANVERLGDTANLETDDQKRVYLREDPVRRPRRPDGGLPADGAVARLAG